MTANLMTVGQRKTLSMLSKAGLTPDGLPERLPEGLPEIHQAIATQLAQQTSYQQTLQQLATLCGDQSSQGQALLQTLLQTLCDQVVTVTQTEMMAHVAATPAGAPSEAQSEPPEDASPPTWQEMLASIGPELQRIRQTQGLSLAILHNRTQVPQYHLQAIEAGQGDKLPELIFVRGFLRRIGAVLGEEAQGLIAQLPQSQPLPNTVAPWQRQDARSSQITPTHLYLGYATLLVSAVGGLAWGGQSSASVRVVPDREPEAVSRAIAPQLAPQLATQKPVVGKDIAPPERSTLD